MKIIHLNASYKPAHIYGGPTMSVSRLCEVLRQAQHRQAQDDRQAQHRQAQLRQTQDDRQVNQKIYEGAKNKEQVRVEVEVLTTTANGKLELHVKAGEKLIVDGVPVTYFKRYTKDHTHFSPGLLFALWKRLGRNGKTLREDDNETGNLSNISNLKSHISIVHIHAWWNLVSILGCLVAVLRNTAVVLSPRGTLGAYSFGNRNDFIKKLIHNFLGKPLLKRCHFHVTSEKEKKDILRLLNPRSITVIPNLVKLTFDPEDSGMDEGARSKEQESFSPEVSGQDQGSELTQNKPFRLLFFSRVEQKKGLELLFEALNNIHTDFRLTIAGGGDEAYIEDLKNLAERYALSQKISWIGQQAPEEKFRILQEHNLMVLPSYDENFANVVVESLSVGTAVLVTENVGLSDYIASKNFGWVCSANSDSIKNILIEACTDGTKRKRIRQTAPQSIRYDFDDNVLAAAYLRMYKIISNNV